MPLAMTERQRRELDEWGFTVLPSFFEEGPELQRLVREVKLWAEREQAPPRDPRSLDGRQPGGGADTPRVERIALEMLDHPRILPYVVDAIGYNIHARDCLLACMPPAAGAAAEDRLAAVFHTDQEEEFAGITHDGTIPLIDFKVSCAAHLTPALTLTHSPTRRTTTTAAPLVSSFSSATWLKAPFPCADYLSDADEEGHACTLVVP